MRGRVEDCREQQQAERNRAATAEGTELPRERARVGGDDAGQERMVGEPSAPSFLEQGPPLPMGSLIFILFNSLIGSPRQALGCPKPATDWIADGHLFVHLFSSSESLGTSYLVQKMASTPSQGPSCFPGASLPAPGPPGGACSLRLCLLCPHSRAIRTLISYH